MTHYRNLETFFASGAEFAKDHPQGAPRYRISFDAIVARRGTVFAVPSGEAVNAFVPFYFSPSTKMAYSIHCGNVPLRDPAGQDLGPASMDDVAFMVVDPKTLFDSGRECWFTDQACNSAIVPTYESDPQRLTDHVEWSLFDDIPTMATIPELGYAGVCRYQHDRDAVPHQQRSKKRMAEFLVKDYLGMDELSGIVLKSDKRHAKVATWMQQAGSTVPLLVKPGCFF
jgi:hypothetical protein